MYIKRLNFYFYFLKSYDHVEAFCRTRQGQNQNQNVFLVFVQVKTILGLVPASSYFLHRKSMTDTLYSNAAIYFSPIDPLTVLARSIKQFNHFPSRRSGKEKEKKNLG